MKPLLRMIFSTAALSLHASHERLSEPPSSFSSSRSTAVAMRSVALTSRMRGVGAAGRGEDTSKAKRSDRAL
jgi:hypothetical protein